MATDNLSIDEATFDRVREQGRRLLTRSPLAKAARYEAGRIHLELDNGCAFEFPSAQTEELTGASAADLRQIKIEGGGLSLRWPTLDVDLYVPNLIRGLLGTRKWMAEIGAVGGKATTHAKIEAARSNGRLGGRPRKSVQNSGA